MNFLVKYKLIFGKFQENSVFFHPENSEEQKKKVFTFFKKMIGQFLGNFPSTSRLGNFRFPSSSRLDLAQI